MLNLSKYLTEADNTDPFLPGGEIYKDETKVPKEIRDRIDDEHTKDKKLEVSQKIINAITKLDPKVVRTDGYNYIGLIFNYEGMGIALGGPREVRTPEDALFKIVSIFFSNIDFPHDYLEREEIDHELYSNLKKQYGKNLYSIVIFDSNHNKILSYAPPLRITYNEDKIYNEMKTYLDNLNKIVVDYMSVEEFI